MSADAPVYRIPKWHFAVLAVPTLAALALGGLLMSKKPLDFDPPGSHLWVPTPVFESLGCFTECANDAQCGEGLACKPYYGGWGNLALIGYRCSADFCASGMGCGTPCNETTLCAAGLACANGACLGPACGPVAPGCGESCEGIEGGGQYGTVIADPSQCQPGFECVGWQDFDDALIDLYHPYSSFYTCWNDSCTTTVLAGACGDSCGVDSPCGAELLCKANEDGSGSSCWHPSCPSVSKENSPPAAVDPNLNAAPNNNIPSGPTTTPIGGEMCGPGWLPSAGCACCGTTLTCSDGTVAPFNPQCGVGGDACKCGDGVCNPACNEDINTCAADCHI